ncbi:MAG: hypothetical protein MUC48_27630 [Leptolyngbya sp. Prado105]|jgi:hypothetical protein|nr:hypothetical protein [Leptolyngbya sp. Prado105]
MATRGVWMKDPHSGGVKISEAVRKRVEQRIKTYADANYAGKFKRIEVRFRGALCYIDAYTKPPEPKPELLKITGETPEQYFERQNKYAMHLCRLRYFGNEESWSLAFYTYSHERYEPSVFNNGTFYGTPEEAFDIGAVYLAD